MTHHKKNPASNITRNPITLLIAPIIDFKTSVFTLTTDQLN
jgi:hypothetical protein